MNGDISDGTDYNAVGTITTTSGSSDIVYGHALHHDLPWGGRKDVPWP